MAGNLSDYAENKILNHLLGVAAFAMPTAVYIGLFTSNPTDGNTGAEVTGNGYARKVATFSTSTAGASSNSADILFPAATGSWGTITHIGLFDAVIGGNLLFHFPLTVEKTITVTDEFKIPTTKTSVSID